MPVPEDLMTPPQMDFETPAPAVVSPLFAMGESRPRFSLPWKIGFGVIGAIALFIALFIALCSRVFSLPENTFFFAIISPRTARTLLTAEQINTLPSHWQRVITSESRWPVVFGLSETSDQGFVLGPRWVIPQTGADSITRGLVRQSGSVSTIKSTPDSTLRYRSLFVDHALRPGTLQGWLYPTSIFPRISSDNRIAFHLEKSELVLTDSSSILESDKNIRIIAPSSTAELHTADLSLHLAALGEGAYRDELLSELLLSPLQTTLLSLSSQVNAIETTLTSTTLKTVLVQFDQPPSLQEAQTLTSLLHQDYKKRLITLPDGTMSIERLASFDETVSSTPLTTQLHWSSEPSQTEHLTPAPRCGRGTWLFRFSPSFLARLMPNNSHFATWLPASSLQVWRSDHKLIICRE